MATVTQQTEGMGMPGTAGSNILNVGDTGTTAGQMVPGAESAAGQAGGAGGGYAGGEQTPQYAQTTVQLDINNPAFGSINIIDGTLSGDINRSITVMAYPNEGYVFSRWEIATPNELSPSTLEPTLIVNRGVVYGMQYSSPESSGVAAPNQGIAQI